MRFNDDAAPDFTPEETLRWLTPETVQRLGAIAHAPAETVEAATAAIPPGSRISMEILGVGSVVECDGQRQFDLTPHGWDVARLAADLSPEE